METKRELIALLHAFPGQEEGDLEQLDEVVAGALALRQDSELDAALFSVFERYPDEDGYGVYWSILHGLEARSDYEPGLLASVRRKPSVFAATMLNRMSNGGHDTCSGVATIDLLIEISRSADASEKTKRTAGGFIELHRG
ncbi:MAG: hypothetical protein DRI90_19825 [Deltaproteobacteria bacterium]|nr:MAG: hypothetical protein DRI90_19825 [Deltaproteobacteria bacterium]